MDNPVVAEVTRNGVVESWHRGAVVALAQAGAVQLCRGDVAAPMFPRSASKPLQLAGLLRAGLRELPGLDDSMLALAAASHSGEPVHLDGVRRLLAAAELTELDLGNAADLPLGPAERRAWRRDGRHKTPLAMNCSGKHAAMLATCVVRGWSLDGYLDPSHPVQSAVLDTLVELTGGSRRTVAVDGCGAPLLALSVEQLARGFRALAMAPPGSPEQQVFAAMRSHPDLVGGTARDVTALIRAVPDAIAKDGAEGVYVVALADGRAAALKIDDGAARPRMPVLVDLLERLGVDASGVQAHARVAVHGGGDVVGEVRSAL